MKSIINTIKHIDKWLLVVSILLFGIGTIMIFSSSNVSFYMNGTASPYKYLIRQIIILCTGVGIGGFFLVLNLRSSTKFSSFCNYLLLISLWLLFVFGKVSNNARSWFDLGPFNIQPSEFFKIFSIVWLAKYFDDKNKDFNKLTTVLFPIFMCGLGFLAILLQPDLGTSIILFLIVALVFLLSTIPANIKKNMVLFGMGALVIVVLWGMVSGKGIISDRQMSRITSVFSSSSPCSEENYYTTGNQVCNGYIAINNGGMKGLGLGNSIQKYLYLPEAHNDFIFSIIAEELGFIGAVMVIALFAIFIWRGIIIAMKAPDTFSSLLAAGITTMVGLQAIINIAVVTSSMPNTGMPLPFFSYGGTSLLILLCSVGILLNISRCAKK